MAGVLQALVGTGRLDTETWNPADKSSDVTLSNFDRTMTGAVNSFQSARGLYPKAAGKWYYEAVIETGSDNLIGVANATASLSNFVGANANGVGYRGLDGNVFINGFSVDTYATYTSGDIVQVALDRGTGKLWFGKNGTFNGNPAAGSGGLGAVASGMGYPMGTTGAVDYALTMRGVGFITYAAPAGFTAWGPP